ncbi:MAG TPA: hypothetical protein VFE62_25145 [Gemmataceae bacterium]|nr:hypothetical protein [Gemmataceae bacterium]
MAKKRQTGQGMAIARWRDALIVSLGLGLMTAAGCSTPTAVVNNPQPADPLMGVRTPPGMPLPTDSPKPAVGWNQQPAQQFGVADTSSTNNATLAGMPWQGPQKQNLAIDNGPKTPGQLTGNTQQTPVTPGFVAPNPAPKVMPIPDTKSTSSWQPQLSTPQPLTTSSMTPTVQAVSSAPAPTPTVQAVSSVPSPTSIDDLTKQLQDRGVLTQKVVPLANGVRLTCLVRRTDGGGFVEKLAEAPDYPSAARAMLLQLDSKSN